MKNLSESQVKVLNKVTELVKLNCLTEALCEIARWCVQNLSYTYYIGYVNYFNTMSNKANLTLKEFTGRNKFMRYLYGMMDSDGEDNFVKALKQVTKQ